jgi:hypothetical protein
MIGLHACDLIMIVSHFPAEMSPMPPQAPVIARHLVASLWLRNYIAVAFDGKPTLRCLGVLGPPPWLLRMRREPDFRQDFFHEADEDAFHSKPRNWHAEYLRV